MKYWLKTKEFKWLVISWGRDKEDPNYFAKFYNGFDLTFKSYRLIIEWIIF